MASRLELQMRLEELLGSRNVYYDPPETLKMSYPAIRYSKKRIDARYADNKAYSRMNCYEVIVIDSLPDNQVIDKLMELPYCSYDRHYPSDNMNHDVLTIFW